MKNLYNHFVFIFALLVMSIAAMVAGQSAHSWQTSSTGSVGHTARSSIRTKCSHSRWVWILNSAGLPQSRCFRPDHFSRRLLRHEWKSDNGFRILG